MLAGPGAMSSVTVLITQNTDWVHRGIVIAAVATASLVSFIVLAAADRVEFRTCMKPESGILTRLMGLLLMAIAWCSSSLTGCGTWASCAERRFFAHFRAVFSLNLVEENPE